LPGIWRCSGAGLPPVLIERAANRDVAESWSGPARLGWRGRVEGRALVVQHGRGGDLLIRLDPSIEVHLSGDGTRLLVAGDEQDRLAMTRLLLDSVLFTVSLRHGHEALHAAAVATEAGVIAVVGPTGAGKSSLVSALLLAGCAFHTDDVLVVDGDRAALRAAPGPPVLTVPNPAPPNLGERLADLGRESWLGVVGADGPRRLAGLLCLEPSRGAGAALDPVDWRWLLGQLLRFPRTPQRERRRFELAADIAGSVPALRLQARSATPASLADSALEWIRSLPGG
jgi:energy-coupling factor transporter ATP-binding protein EcfA2